MCNSETTKASPWLFCHTLSCSALRATHQRDPHSPEKDFKISILNPSQNQPSVCSSHTVPKQNHIFRDRRPDRNVSGSHTAWLCVLEPRRALSSQTFVVEGPEEGVSVCALEKGVLNLHLPPAQLLAARKPLRQRQDAPALLQLLLDGIESLLRGLGGCPQPRALENKTARLGSAMAHTCFSERVNGTAQPCNGTKRSCYCKGRTNTTTQQAQFWREVEEQLLSHDLSVLLPSPWPVCLCPCCL